MMMTRFRPGIAATLATLVVMAVCVRLGLWQLEREAEKRAWQAQVDSRGTAPEQSLASLMQRPDPAHYPVTFNGTPLNGRTVLLDNRMLEGVAGYYVYTPVVADSGPTVLVNRGWTARGPSREQLPEVPPLPAPVAVVGHSYVPSKAFTLDAAADTEAPSWPLRVQALDLAQLATTLEAPLAPFVVRVAPEHALESGEQLARVWHDARLGPERHRAYAVQWFALAAAVLVIFFFASLRKTKPETELDA